MRKLLLLDADVVIDFHTLGLPGPLDLKTVRQFCFEKADLYQRFNICIDNVSILRYIA